MTLMVRVNLNQEHNRQASSIAVAKEISKFPIIILIA